MKGLPRMAPKMQSEGRLLFYIDPVADPSGSGGFDVSRRDGGTGEGNAGPSSSAARRWQRSGISKKRSRNNGITGTGGKGWEK